MSNDFTAAPSHQKLSVGTAPPSQLGAATSRPSIRDQNRAFGRALRALAHVVDTKWPDAPNSITQLAAMAQDWMALALEEIGGPRVPEKYMPGFETLLVTSDPALAPWNQPEAQP